MNTDFIFENIIYFPVFTLVALAVYFIQFCSVVSPCNIEFDEDSRREMNIMYRYNILSERAFSSYLGCMFAGIFVSLIAESTLILMILMIIQLIYMIPVGFLMFSMYARSKRYWSEKSLTSCRANMYN